MNLLERTRWIILRNRTDILCGTTRGLEFKPLADTGCTPVKTYFSRKKAIHSLESYLHMPYDNDVYQAVEVSEILDEHLPQPKIQAHRQKISRFQDIPQFTKEGSYNGDYPLNYLVKWIEEAEFKDGLILNPDFQRGHVWTPKQQKAYVEFLLRGGKTGRNLYFNNPSGHERASAGAYNDFLCVDGLQRITAISKFIHGKLKVFDSYYHEFTDKLPITNTIRVNINTLKTKQDVLQWYIDLNAGGTPHSEEEIMRVKAMLGDLS